MMPHLTVLPESSDVETVFSLDACQSCEAGCKGDYQSFHCPICPVSKFKPSRKQKVISHLKAHFFGPRGNVEVRGYRITCCPMGCGDYKAAVSRSHFHCPFCERTFTKKPFLTQHANICRGPLDQTLSDIQRMDTVSPEDVIVETLGRDEVPITEPEPVNTTTEAISPPEESVQTNSAECTHCQKKYHRKYIRAHIRDQHQEQSRPEIHSGRHHHASIIDSELGVFSVSKTIRGVLQPIHVVRRTMGTDHMVECEVNDCRDLCQVEWRSGNPSFLCDHLKSTEFAHGSSVIMLSREKLQEMGKNGFISTARQQSCIALQEKANKDERPLLVEVPQMSNASRRYTFYSIYTGKNRWWCRYKRTIVTIDKKTSSIMCRCKSKGCEHRGLVKWALYQAF